MFNFLHTFHPNPILLNLGPIKIHWYGLMMASGFIIGFFLVRYLFEKYRLSKEKVFDLSIWGLIGALIGARIYYVVYAWEFYKDNLDEIFKVWHGGLAVHGVLIGGIIGIYFYCKKNKLGFGKILDIIAPAMAFGHVVGRWGNYFNQELYGTPTDLPWGIPIDLVNRAAGYEMYEFFHPTFLYEIILALIMTAVLLLLHKRRLKKQNPHYGVLCAGYLLMYSIIRFIMEFYRIDYSPIIFGVRWAQLFSVFVFFGAGIFIFIKIFRKKKNSKIVIEE